MIAFDLILFALIAAGLVFWLKNILGTRHGSEQDIPNPYAEAAQDAAAAAVDDVLPRPHQPPPGLNPIRNAVEKGAQEGLAAIVAADRSFDPAHFVQGAEKAFAMIVEAFAKGERAVLKKLLAPSVYDAFDAALTAREVRGETVITDVHAVRRADIIEAKLDGSRALIALRFLADETTVTKDVNGTIISGDPDRIIEMVDVWAFAKDLRAPGPIWQVVETREDRPEPAGAAPFPVTHA